MSQPVATVALAGVVILAATATALTADARGGFSGGGRGGFSGGGRSAPTSIHGTTPNGTHYAAGPNGAAEAGHGQWSSTNSSGYHNSGSYGTTANGTHYATGNNGAVAANDGHYASTGYDNGYHGTTVNTVNVDNGWNAGGYAAYHPVAVGAAVATTAAVTAAVVGSSVYALPPSCVAYTYGTAYYNCGGAWYQPQYQGSSVTYVVVNAPQ